MREKVHADVTYASSKVDMIITTPPQTTRILLPSVSVTIHTSSGACAGATAVNELHCLTADTQGPPSRCQRCEFKPCRRRAVRRCFRCSRR